MSINLIAGQMLQNTLVRDGAPISFVNSSNGTPTLYIDSANNQIGINTSTLTPTAQLTIQGNAYANFINLQNNISLGGDVYANGNVNANSLTVNLMTGTITTNAQPNVTTLGNLTNLTVLGNTVVNSISGNVANITTVTSNTLNVTNTANFANVTITNLNVTGNTTSNASSSTTGNVTAANFFTTGNISATGNIFGGNVSIAGSVRANTVSAAGLVITGTSNLANISITNTTMSGVGNLIAIAGNSGFIVPVGNTAQRPGSPVIGTVRFNTIADQLETWDGTAWILSSNGNGGGSSGSIADQQITGDGVTTVYTLNQSATSTGIIVSINGVLQLPNSSYSVTGYTITFNEPLLTGDTADIRFISYTATVSGLVNTPGNTTVYVTNTPDIEFTVAGNLAATFNSDGLFTINQYGVKLPSYTVNQAAALSTPQPGQVIYVSNGASGLPCLAVYDGISWKQVNLGATIST